VQINRFETSCFHDVEDSRPDIRDCDTVCKSVVSEAGWSLHSVCVCSVMCSTASKTNNELICVVRFILLRKMKVSSRLLKMTPPINRTKYRCTCNSEKYRSNPNRHYRVHKSHKFPPYLPKIHSNIIFPPTPMFQRGHFPSS